MSDDQDSFLGDITKTKRASMVILCSDTKSLGLQNLEIYYEGEK